MKENKTSGGWVFKTPQIDPTVQTNLELVLEVKNSGVGGQTRHGLVRVPVTTSDSLCDANRPFRNMWRPLCEELHTSITIYIYIYTHMYTGMHIHTLYDYMRTSICVTV